MKAKNVILFIIASILGGFASLWLNNYINSGSSGDDSIAVKSEVPAKNIANFNHSINTEVDFTQAAKKSIDAVVHITTKYTQKYRTTLSDFFYGSQGQTYSKEVPLASGSGVIVSNDGYIVTNNHVIENSDKIMVVLNDKRTYTAELIGRDKSTDLALLKIEDKNLPFLTYGNSDNLSIGQWVLAVGNPFNLNSTVTAGIISAKARNINILSQNYAIESFIQTDAAVNPGNSGGALVNTDGELVGINTAIASKTGSYVGYSFAIPVSIVKKIVADLVEFKEVQRAYLGVNISDVNEDMKNKLNLDKIEGLYVSTAIKSGAAYKAGINKGDIIIKINDIPINNLAQLQEQISQYRPGETIKVAIKRKGKIKMLKVVLHNKFGNTDIVRNSNIIFLGAELGEVPTNIKRYLSLKYGVQVKDIGNKELFAKDIRDGFIITSINKVPIYEPADLLSILKNSKSKQLLITGIYPNGMSAYYFIN